MPLPPVRREVVVATDPERAFRLFTDAINEWWPMSSHSVFEAGSLVGFGDGVLAEATVDGREAIWGEILDWEPGRILRLSWHPGDDVGRATQLTVSFSAADGGALVALEHSGWEVLAHPQAERDDYEEGWPGVLAAYAERAEIELEQDDTWVALLHTPGPSAPTDGSLFADPRFSEHVAFLQRMDAAGYLVAAGPFVDEDGSGMTILRLPGEDRLAEATALATETDVAVTSGLLSVRVRPWDVMFDATA